MGFFLVMKAEIVRGFIIMRRYWFATLVGMVIGYGALLGLLYAFLYRREAFENYAQRFAATATEKGLSFMIGLFAFSVVGQFTRGLQSLARTGQLEQLCMSPHGLVTNFMARSMVGAISNVLSLTLMVWMISVTVGGQVHFELSALVASWILIYFNLLGFGFMAGGLVLVFKTTGQVESLVRFGLICVAFIANENIVNYPLPLQAFLHILPVTDGAICLKLTLLDGLDLWGLITHPSAALLYSMISCCIWTSIGITCFRIMESYSRKKGTLGAY